MKMIEMNTPESVGMSSSRVNEIDAAMQAFIDQGKIAGIATLIARRSKVVHLGCYGKLDLAANKPVQPDSLFRIYSLTKPITSVAALMLYEEGHFSLDDPVSKWLPAYPHVDGSITLRQLLNHTSGLYMFWDNQALWDELQMKRGPPEPVNKSMSCSGGQSSSGSKMGRSRSNRVYWPIRLFTVSRPR